jgi:hypothetical protein
VEEEVGTGGWNGGEWCNRLEGRLHSLPTVLLLLLAGVATVLLLLLAGVATVLLLLALIHGESTLYQGRTE